MSQNMKWKIFLVSAALLILPTLTFAGGKMGSRGVFRQPPAPQLVSPLSDKVDLTGKTSLEFKWIVGNRLDADSYDFRLYKGYDMYASTLIMKKTLEANTNSITINADLFENGQVYTWSLRQISYSDEKSDKSFSSFKVTKG